MMSAQNQPEIRRLCVPGCVGCRGAWNASEALGYPCPVCRGHVECWITGEELEQPTNAEIMAARYAPGHLLAWWPRAEAGAEPRSARRVLFSWRNARAWLGVVFYDVISRARRAF